MEFSFKYIDIAVLSPFEWNDMLSQTSQIIEVQNWIGLDWIGFASWEWGVQAQRPPRCC